MYQPIMKLSIFVFLREESLFKRDHPPHSSVKIVFSSSNIMLLSKFQKGYKYLAELQKSELRAYILLNPYRTVTIVVR